MTIIEQYREYLRVVRDEPKSTDCALCGQPVRLGEQRLGGRELMHRVCRFGDDE